MVPFLGLKISTGAGAAAEMDALSTQLYHRIWSITMHMIHDMGPHNWVGLLI